MKKNGAKKLESLMDIKIFLLYLLDNIRYPIDYTTLSDIISQNVDSVTLDYEECLYMLVQSGHLLYDEVLEEKYYMISDKGRLVAAELYDGLDKEFRERSLRSAIKHISLSKSEATVKAYITELPTKRFRVTMEAQDKDGEIMTASLSVSSRAEAELIKKNFESKPDGVYRGVLFAATGRIEYLA